VTSNQLGGRFGEVPEGSVVYFVRCFPFVCFIITRDDTSRFLSTDDARAGRRTAFTFLSRNASTSSNLMYCILFIIDDDGVVAVSEAVINIIDR